MPSTSSGPLGVEQRPDRGEGEAAGLEVADLGQPVEVVLAVDLGPAGPLGRGEQALALVEADRVDGQPGAPGQLVDPDGPVGSLTGRSVLIS